MKYRYTRTVLIVPLNQYLKLGGAWEQDLLDHEMENEI